MSKDKLFLYEVKYLLYPLENLWYPGANLQLNNCIYMFCTSVLYVHLVQTFVEILKYSITKHKLKQVGCIVHTRHIYHKPKVM